jgi:hypothetical protein
MITQLGIAIAVAAEIIADWNYSRVMSQPKSAARRGVIFFGAGVLICW